jgi:molybdopterin/thiamine biosynthesis adenylyltransferase
VIDPRFVRQVLLPEIGEAGQAAIGRASAALAGPPGDLAHAVASDYAAAAGFARVTAGVIDVDALAPAAITRDPSARAVLAGSRAALAAVRAALAGGAS